MKTYIAIFISACVAGAVADYAYAKYGYQLTGKIASLIRG